MRRDTKDEVNVLEQDRIEAGKKLFQLTDLNGDGLITPEEFALMGLNQTKAHAENKVTQHDEQIIKGVFISWMKTPLMSCSSCCVTSSRSF